MTKSNISSLGELLLDRMNPVLLREFRQLSRNRIVFSIIFLCLAAFMLTSGIYIMTAMDNLSTGSASLQQGKNLFNSLATMLILATFTFVPLYTGIRFGIERRKGKQDLMYTSSIPPWHIVFGKTMTAAQLTLLIFSLALPFLAFTYLLRGVDLANAALTILALFIGAVLGAQAVLLFMAIPMNLVVRIIISVLLILPTFFSYYIAASIVLLWSGGAMLAFGSPFSTHGFIPILIFALIIVISLSGTLFTMTTALIAPPSSNRAFAIRSYNSIAAIVIMAATLICLHKGSSLDAIAITASFLLAGACLSLIASSAETTTRSLRVQRTIPKNIFKRLLVFPLYQGRINGIVWSLGWMLVLSCIITAATVMDGEEPYEVASVLGSVILYTLGYTLVSIFIHRKLLIRKFKAGITPVITGVFILIMILAPFLFAFFSGSKSRIDKAWSLFSPVDDDYMGHISEHLTGAVILVVIGLILNGVPMIKSILSFCPLQKTAPGPAKVAEPEPETEPQNPLNCDDNPAVPKGPPAL